MANKKNEVFANFIWRFAERCGAQGVSFLLSIILARLLMPEVYGELAIVIVIISLLNTFINSGMGVALVQKKDADELDFSTLFYFNFISGLLLYVILFFIAPLIANFYANTRLIPVIRALGFSLIIAGVKNIQISYVSKNLIFKKFFYSTLAGSVISALIGIVMAYCGFGIWALVAQYIINDVISTLVLWFTISWRPKWQFSVERLKGLFSYGWKLLISNLLSSLYENVRQLLIGKIYTTKELAFYNKGNNFPTIIITNINYSIDSVLLPTMAREQNDVERVKSMTRRSIRTSTYIIAPMMVGLAVCAEPLIKLILTEKWLECVFFLRIFCVTYMFYPIHTANLNAIKAMGRSDWFLKLEIAKKVVGTILVLSTMFISVRVMAYSLLFDTLFSTVINAYPNKKLLNYSWGEQIKDILPYLLLAVGMGIPVYLLSLLHIPIIIILALQVIVGALIYIGISAIFKFEIFYYLLGILKGFLKRGQ